MFSSRGSAQPGAQWWLGFLLFGAIVLLFVIAALATDPLSVIVP